MADNVSGSNVSVIQSQVYDFMTAQCYTECGIAMASRSSNVRPSRWGFMVIFWFSSKTVTCITRMVQLPATAAIEYVAACCRIRTRTRTRTKTKTGTKTKIGTITKTVRGPYARSPQVQYVYAPSGLSVPSIVAWRTKKQTDKLGLLAPRGVDPHSPNFLGM